MPHRRSDPGGSLPAEAIVVLTQPSHFNDDEFSSTWPSFLGGPSCTEMSRAGPPTENRTWGLRMTDPVSRGVDLGKFRVLAEQAARRWPSLAPRGGRRWTNEDLDRAISILFEISQSSAFLARSTEGMDTHRRRGYLLAALHNRLVDFHVRAGRILLLDTLSLDATPGPAAVTTPIATDDLLRFSERLIGRMPTPVAAELSRRLGGKQPRDSARPSDENGPSVATRTRRWADARVLIRAFAGDEGLTREELAQVLTAVADGLSAGAGSREIPDRKS